MPVANDVRARLFTVAALCAAAASYPSTQTPSAADGPWAGWAQCVLTGQFANQGQTYGHQQTHTWVLTSATPLPSSTVAIKQYAATWQVTGQGSRQRGQGNGQGNSEQWTTAGQPMADALTIRLTAEGTIRIGGAAQLRSVGTTTGTVLPYVDEWSFPVIEGPATQTSISGSAPSATVPNFSGAPPGTSSSGMCTWNFVRGGGTPPPPPGQQSITRDQVIPPGGLAGAVGGTATVNPSPTPTVPGGVAVVNPSPIANLPGGTATAGPSPTTTAATPVPLATASAGPTPTTTPESASRTQPLAPLPAATVGPCSLAGPIVLTDKTVATSSGVQLVWKRDAFTYSDYSFIGFLTAADVEYTVMRTDLGSPVGSIRASNGAARLDTDTLAFRHDTKLDGSRRTYTYKIRARHFRQDLVASGPNSNTNYLRRVDVVGTHEDGCGETEFSITAPGPAPAGIKALAFPNSDPITNSCSVRIDVNWAPVPGATGYTVYNENAALGPRIPLTTLSFFYKQGGLRLSDLVQGAILSALGSEYTNGPRFKRGVNIRVAASFGDRPESMSEVVPYTFSTYPCWDGLGDR